ncbi:undecaprenyldiphospho-muramoylpentapeptide beta-N-acetylglucosaminyltransferase [Polluticoccus soli]|uniref:undecaprenyldiphospho-muramoylpentapeptide beta-N-acetylglucosaminyltransferase n=1 Tax=Polluticoccus soli TaxID=3034150 RepID=UPI0023E2CAD0|nr:undecaprenyldiphospho-muramoylpentapeptide beta-N-acetylglucosaminyltransferase [Flavipsychrobacter sp. JY13-12]
MRVIIAGGGTGGHIFPAVAIAHALQRLQPDTELLFVGALGKMEMEKVPQEGFKIVGLDIAGFNRSNMLKNLMLPFKIFKSHLKAKSIIKEFQPNAVVGVGGFASFPMLNAAQSMGVPTLVQEQNSYAGKSNKILGKKAKAVCVAYEHMEKFFPADKLILAGNPVRKVISGSTVSRSEGQAFFKLDPNRKTILIVGGSLGAKSINEAIDAGLADLTKGDVQLVWQTGKPYFEQAKKAAEPYGDKVRVFEFIRDMDKAYAAADMIVSRAGALAIAEMCIAAKPVIFVPYPYAAEDHQTSNAMALVEHNAAQMVKDNETKTELVKKIKALLHNASMQEIMQQSLKKMAIKDADERIAAKIIEIAA